MERGRSIIKSRLMQPFYLVALIFVIVGTAGTTFFITIAPSQAGKLALPIAIATIGTAAILAIALGYRTASRTEGPLLALYKAAHEVERGNFDARVDIRTQDEFQQLGASFNQMIQELERTQREHERFERSKTEFLSITSHELRSPMTVMKAQLQMLTGGYVGHLTPSQRASLDIVLRNTQRLDGIIADLLDVSRLEAARLKFTFASTDLHELLHRFVAEITPTASEKRIKIRLATPTFPTFDADPDRILQILRNLVGNAIKFSPTRGHIIIRAKQVGQYILLSVQDFGIGIPKDKQKGIFEPFYQVDTAFSRQHGGTGLGLTICRGIVESQHGKIWFESEAHKGTTFFFTIPLEPIRDVQPVRLLFSSTKYKEDRLAQAFSEALGPVGILELEDHKENLSESSLSRYVDSLEHKGILDTTAATALKERIREVLSPPPGGAAA